MVSNDVISYTPGDLILEVGKINVIGWNHAEVGKLLKSSPPLVELVIYRRYKSELLILVHMHDLIVVCMVDQLYDYEGEEIDISLKRDVKLGFGN